MVFITELLNTGSTNEEAQIIARKERNWGNYSQLQNSSCCEVNWDDKVHSEQNVHCLI
jgi:hypothetical protein